MVPSAKVEFFLVNPSLGFDVRFATRIGVGQGGVDAFGATEISVDYQVPADLAGHYCLFARVFSFAPLDLPYSDYALDPTIDRHVAHQNLSILAATDRLDVGLVHFPNARDRIELLALTAAELRMIRDESVAGPRVMTPAQSAGFHLRRSDADTGRVTGGITFFLRV